MYKYIVNANADVRQYHEVILKAIENNGVFDDDYADIFKLTKCPEWSACEYSLYFI
jgi:hypothetical protein